MKIVRLGEADIGVGNGVEGHGCTNMCKMQGLCLKSSGPQAWWHFLSPCDLLLRSPPKEKTKLSSWPTFRLGDEQSSGEPEVTMGLNHQAASSPPRCKQTAGGGQDTCHGDPPAEDDDVQHPLLPTKLFPSMPNYSTVIFYRVMFGGDERVWK